MKSILNLLCHLFLVQLFYSATWSATIQHQLHVEIFPQETGGYLKLLDQVEIDEQPSYFLMPKSHTQLYISFNGVSLRYSSEASLNETWIKITPFYPEGLSHKGTLSISYDFYPQFIELSAITADVEAVILNDGVYLSPSSYWYPQIGEGGFEKNRLEVNLPQGWQSVTSGNLVESKTISERRIDQWVVDHPSERIHLIANKFIFNELPYKGIKLQTYFHPELAVHSEEYLQKLKKYVDIYIDYFGSYPYEKFAVVSNFFSTGFGMASYTLLDRYIIPYSFIVDVSLGHEFLHNYWGNSVYVKENTGNWCEGLTVYGADYFYEAQKGTKEAMAYRRDIIRKYENYVDHLNSFPVKDFISRYNSVSQVIGYGKVMMIFHMLEKAIGSENFKNSLVDIYNNYRFESLTWMDLKKIFEKYHKSSLQNYFDQWINRSDILELNFEYIVNNDESVDLFIKQGTETPYQALIPFLFTYQSGKNEWKYIQSTQLIDRVSVQLHNQEKILKIELDPYFELMRKPFSFENPATFNKFWGSRNTQYVSFHTWSKELEENLNFMISTFDNKEVGKKILFADPQSYQIPNNKNLFLFLSAENLNDPQIKELLNKQNKIKFEKEVAQILNSNEKIDLKTSTMSFTLDIEDRVYTFFVSSSEMNTILLANKLSHFGKWSYLAWDKADRKIAAGIW